MTYKYFTTIEKIESGIKLIEKDGGKFSQGEKGMIKFVIQGIEGNFGYYKLPNDELQTLVIEITDKPFYVSSSLIEIKLKEFFV